MVSRHCERLGAISAELVLNLLPIPNYMVAAWAKPSDVKRPAGEAGSSHYRCLQRRNLGIAGMEILDPPEEDYPHNLYVHISGAVSMQRLDLDKHDAQVFEEPGAPAKGWRQAWSPGQLPRVQQRKWCLEHRYWTAVRKPR